MVRNKNHSEMRIVWARDILLDVHLHKTTEIGILQQLAEHGYEVFFVSAHSKQKTSIFQNPRIHVFSVPVGKNLPFVSRFIFTFVQFFYYIYFLIKIKPLFVVVDPDSIYGLLPTLPLYRLLKSKIILDIRSTPTPILNSESKVTIIQRLIDLSFYVAVEIAKKKLDGMTIITDLMKKEICNEFKIDPKWVGVWSSGVSTKLFDYEKFTGKALELRKELGFIDKFLICYHGGFTQSRGLIDTMNAISLLKDSNPAIILFLLGTGSTQTLKDMKELIRDNGLENRIIVHEPVNFRQVPKYVAMCDVGIIPLPNLPQWRNQCPLKLLEYLAMKKVVILTDIPCHREIVGDSECGVYSPSTRPDDIARSIVFAYDNKERLQDWGAKGRFLIENEYTWEKVSEKLENYLRKL
jgi:glycosyltransferase involved in cell wall biosynthesis